MANLSVALSEYLASIATKKWGYGSLDCCIFMADWVLLNTSRDPMSDRRGTYSTKNEFQDAIESEGGIISSCSSRFSSSGLSKTNTPKAGDVLLVRSPLPTGAICVSRNRFAVVTSDIGLLISTEKILPLIKAWTFKNG